MITSLAQRLPFYYGWTIVSAGLGAITGITQFFTTFVLAPGPLFAGAVFDATDAYTRAYRTLGGTWLLTAFLMLTVKPSRARLASVAETAG